MRDRGFGRVHSATRAWGAISSQILRQSQDNQVARLSKASPQKRTENIFGVPVGWPTRTSAAVGTVGALANHVGCGRTEPTTARKNSPETACFNRRARL